MLEALIHRLRAGRSIPFVVEQVARPDEEVHALFRASFGVPAPDFPLHMVARWTADGSARGYVHYTRHDTGVYLCGGLCVDTRPYRRMTPAERDRVRESGSLSRWLLRESIAALPAKKAVFAYTGNAMSLRDCLALGFESTPHRHLIVQWHAAPSHQREAMVSRVAAVGPF